MSKRKRNVSITSIMTDEEIREIKKHQLHKQQIKKNKKKKERYDFISMILINGTIDDILKLSRYLIRILNYDQNNKFKYPYEYEESLFSNHQPIIIENNSYLNFTNQISFRLYYNDVYNDSISFNNNILKLNNKNELILNKNDNDNIDENYHEYNNILYNKKTLLRLCFLIAFLKDFRINRFVMAYHSIHQNKLKTKAPLRDRTIRFIEKANIHIDYFLKNQINIRNFNEIDDIVKNCISLWINYYIMGRKNDIII